MPQAWSMVNRVACLSSASRGFPTACVQHYLYTRQSSICSQGSPAHPPRHAQVWAPLGPMAPKRAGKNMTQDQLKQLLESRALDDTVDKINKRLKDDHGMASRILRMIDTGYFNKEEAIEEGKLPQSCNKFRLVHKGTLVEIILAMVWECPGLQAEAAAKLVSKVEGTRKKHDITRILCFLCRVEEGSAIPTRYLKEFQEWREQRHADVPRAHYLEFDEVKNCSSPAFERIGCFQVDSWDADQQKYMKLKHSEGEAIDIPSDWAVTAKFVMAHNWSEVAARVKCPASSGGVIDCKVRPLFTQAGIDIPEPYMMDEIQTPLNAKKRCRSTSPSGSVASTRSKESRNSGAAEQAAPEVKTFISNGTAEGVQALAPLAPAAPKPAGAGGALAGLD